MHIIDNHHEDGIPKNMMLKTLYLHIYPNYLEKVQLFDIYRDSKIGENKKSVAYSLSFRDKNRTLNDEEIDSTMHSIVAELEKVLGAEMRK